MNKFPLWLPLKGPPLPESIFPPWPWVKAIRAGLSMGIASQVQEGATVPCAVTITNHSVKGTESISASFRIIGVATYPNGTKEQFLTATYQAYGPGEAKTYNQTLHIPVGTAGNTMTIHVEVWQYEPEVKAGEETTTVSIIAVPVTATTYLAGIGIAV